MELAAAVRSGDRLGLARLLTLVENNDPAGLKVLDQLFPLTGKAHLVGITGSPGSGKSSLVNQLALRFRSPRDASDPVRVGIVAVDPTSPFSGGALLGDRVRMRDLSGDPGIFIRSMASRGALGGLAVATSSIVSVLDAAGFDMILIETVGAGQAEVDIARLAHTTVVVESPGMGDDIQAIKAGILEIADILVVNKADRPGVDATERALKVMLEMGFSERARRGALHAPQCGDAFEPESNWQPPVLRSTATTGEGVDEVARQIHLHAMFLRRTGEWERREVDRLENELELRITQALHDRWRAGITTGQWQNVLAKIAARTITPAAAVESLLK